MTQDHLLPANATPLEKALSLAMDGFSRLAPPADAIRTFKRDAGNPLLPWLIWEYGLEELLPYLPDPKRAIAEGILWQRLRGTPAALTTALSWIGMRAIIEQEPPGVHFSEFQIDPGEVLDSDRTIANLIAIARLSAPARARLSRIYHGYDLRRFVLDVSRLGEALLSDDSGIFWRDGKTKLSFGRSFSERASAAAQRVASDRDAVRFAVARLIDRFLLDFSSLGDPGPTRNEEMLHAHLFTFANALGAPDPKPLLPERRFVRAMLVLSDSAPLGDINARTPRRALFRTRTTSTLGDLLLGEMAEIEWRELTEMQIGLSGFTEAEPYGFAASRANLHRLLTQAAASHDATLARPSRLSLASSSAAWQGQTWTGVRWPQSSWQDTRELVGASHASHP